MRNTLLFCVILAALLPCSAAAEQGGLVESSEVRVIPISATLWPKNGDAALCSEIPSLIREGKLTVVANGTKRDISTFDIVGIDKATIPTDTPATEKVAGLNIVLVFDWWHMGEPGCTELDSIGNRTRGAGRAFDWARSFFKQGFRAGVDQVMIASFAGSLDIHSDGWITDPTEALRILNTLERSPRTSFAELEHNTLDDWFKNLGLLAEALGNYEGTKDVFLLASDMPVDADESEELSKLGAYFQSNKAQLHTIDLAYDQRVLPYGLLPISEWTGGHLFTDKKAELGAAIQELRTIANCRIGLYFKPDAKERNIVFSSLEVRLDDNRFRLEAPKIYIKQTSDKEQELALAFLKHFEKGIAVQSGIMVDVPASVKKGTWRAYLTVRVNIVDPSIKYMVPAILIEAVAINLDEKRQETIVSHYLGGQYLADLYDGKRGSYTVVVPFTARPGQTKVVVVAYSQSAKSEARASDHSDTYLPAAPGPYWTIADRIARIDKTTVAAPLLNNKGISTTTQVLAMGYACSDDSYNPSKGTPSPKGVFINGSQKADVELVRTSCPGGTFARSGCGCFLGYTTEQLHPGEWTLELPGDLRPQEPLRFKVLPHVTQIVHKK